MTDEQEGILKERAKRLKSADKIGKLLGSRFLLAGGALSKCDNPKDFDIYGVDAPLDIIDIEDRVLYHSHEMEYVCSTGNAITIRVDGQVVQLCKFFKPVPQATIEGFDFAHCMAGAVFSASGELRYVVATQDFWRSELKGTTWYTGSEYPLSSLMRAMKFHKRGLFAREDHKAAALSILFDIVSRGFKDYDDFMDQCASVSESFQNINCVDDDSLYDLLEKKEERR